VTVLDGICLFFGHGVSFHIESIAKGARRRRHPWLRAERPVLRGRPLGAVILRLITGFRLGDLSDKEEMESLRMALKVLLQDNAVSKRQSVNTTVLTINPPFALFTPRQ
jgi:hypothetical protein